MTDAHEEFRVYVGIDWASKAHQVCVLDARGTVRSERQVAHKAQALEALATALIEAGGGEAAAVAVGIEVPHGAVVETLLERGLAVFALNPKQLDRFRDRFTVAGAKDDRRDARVLADAVRTDRRALLVIHDTAGIAQYPPSPLPRAIPEVGILPVEGPKQGVEPSKAQELITLEQPPSRRRVN
jgi:hypothetical protein